MSEEVVNWPRVFDLGSEEFVDKSQRRRILEMLALDVPIARIARKEGVDRKTIYRLRNEPLEDPPPLKRGKDVLLAPYEDQLKEWAQKEATAVWMYQQLTEKHGCRGSYDTVKRRVAQIRPPRSSEGVIRFETQPGEQAQMDWAHFKLADSPRKERRFYAFVFTLSYSRWMALEWVWHCDVKTIIRCHEKVFRELVGVPFEILYDRQSPVYQRQSGPEIVLNPIFEQFARHWGFEPTLAQARRGQTKGKVERPIRYIRSNFFQGLEVFTCLEDIQQKSGHWLLGQRPAPSHHRKTARRASGGREKKLAAPCQ